MVCLRVRRAWPLLGAVALAAGCMVSLALVVQRSFGEPVQSVHGVLLEVRARNLVYAESLTVRDDQGRTWIFQVDPEVFTNREAPQTASHLRQHMALADPVVVHYRRTADGLVALRVLDTD